MSHLALYLLGPPRIECDGQPVDIRRRKAIALLAYLAATGQSHSRDALATLFWPEHDQSRARAGLRRALASVKNGLGEGWLEIDRECVALNLQAEVWLDVQAFHKRLAACGTHSHPPEEVCPDCLPLLAQAAAHVGLARITHVFRETEQTLDRLGIAEKLYRQAGQIERAEQVAEERTKLEP